MNELNELWLEYITKGYIARIKTDERLIALTSDIIPLVAESLSRTEAMPDSGEEYFSAIGAKLMGDEDLRIAVADLVDDSALNESSDDLMATVLTETEKSGFAAGDFMSSLNMGSQRINFFEEPDPVVAGRMADNDGGLYDPPEEVTTYVDFDGQRPSLPTYVDKIAEENKLLMVPELFRNTQLYRNLHEKGWIRKINPKEEEKLPSFSPTGFADSEEESTETQEAYDMVLGQAADADIFDAYGYYVFTEQAEKQLPQFFEQLGIPFDRTDVNAYEAMKAGLDVLADSRRIEDQDTLVMALTGDDTLPISPASYEYLTEGRQFHVKADQVDRWQQQSGLSQHNILRLIKTMHKELGEETAQDAWQMMMMALEENNDYTEDDVHINNHISAADAKFAKYISMYDDAANTYRDAEGNVYNELAYLHLIEPSIAGKIWNNQHDELTVGEVRAIQDAYTTMDTFHQYNGFTPGFSFNNEGRAFIDSLTAGRMSDDYKFAQGYDEIPDEFKQFVDPEDVEKRREAAQENLTEDFYSTQDPTKTKATEKAFGEMYKQWFLDDPSDKELDRFMSWWAGKENDYRIEAASYNYYSAGGTPSPYLDPNTAAGGEMENLRLGMAQQDFLRDDPRYSQLYGRKPTGMSEPEYQQAFTNRAVADYGTEGELRPDLIKAGMSSGDPNVITRAGIISGEGYDNSQYMRKIMTLRNAFRRET